MLYGSFDHHINYDGNDDNFDDGDNDDVCQCPDFEDESQGSILRTPLRSLQGHSGVVISGDWLPGGDQVHLLRSLRSLVLSLKLFFSPIELIQLIRSITDLI